MLKGIVENARTLKAIYPPFLLALLLFPSLVGLLTDYRLFELRNVLIDLIWLPILTIPNFRIRKKAYYSLVTVVVFLLGFIQIGHWIIVKGPLTMSSLLVISNSNLAEAMDFFDLKASAEWLILIPYTFLLVPCFRHIPDYERSGASRNLSLIVLGISLIFIAENAWNQRLVRKGIPQVAKVGFSFYERLQLFREASEEVAPKSVNALATGNYGQQTLVLIIGESCSRRHMSLYGYKRPTNPLLSKRKDIEVFNNVVSPYSNTLEALLSSLSNSSLDLEQSPDNEADVIDVFHSASFKTYWISNQSPIGIWDNQVTVLANKSDRKFFVNLSSNSSFEATYTASYDEKIFGPFEQSLLDTASKKFIVLHLMGSHAAYRKRYPKEYAIFTDDSNEKSRLISEYDNSVLYNDYVVDRLFEIMNKSCGNSYASALYLSDHGENVYDEQNEVGHVYASDLPKANVEIPFVLWLSPEVRAKNPDLTTIVETNRNTPFVSDDLFHSLMDLGGLESPLFDAKRSLFSPQFNSDRPRVLEDGRNYDEK